MAKNKKRNKKYHPRPILANPILKLVDRAMPVNVDAEQNDRMRLLFVGNRFQSGEVVEDDFVKASCYFRVGFYLAKHFESDLHLYMRQCHEFLREAHREWLATGSISSAKGDLIREGIQVMDTMREKASKGEMMDACELAYRQINRAVSDDVGKKLRFKTNGEMYEDRIEFPT